MAAEFFEAHVSAFLDNAAYAVSVAFLYSGLLRISFAICSISSESL